MKLSPAYTRRFVAGLPVVVFDDGTVLPVVAGGDGPVAETLPDEVRDRLGRLVDLTDEEVGELETDLLAHLDDVTDVDEGVEITDEDIAAAAAARDAINQVRSDAERRYTEAAEADAEAERRRAELEAIRNEVAGEEDEGEGDGEEQEGEGESEGEGNADGNQEQEAEGDQNAEGEGEQEQEAIAAGAASGSRSHRPDLGRVAARARRSQRQRQRQTSDRPRVTLVAAADLAGFAAGEVISDHERLAMAIVDRADALRGVTPGSNGMRYLVARGRAEYPEERRLTDNAALNTRRLEAAMGNGLQPIAASGGVCAPLMPDYTQLGISDDSRPGRGSLANFNADRGGVLTMAPPRFHRGLTAAELAEDSAAHDFSGGVGQWTQANDVALNDPATKNLAKVDCEEQDTTVTYAVTQRLQIGNFYNMTYPERVRAIVDVLNAEHAALGERLLLDAIAAKSKHVSAAQGLGAARDILAHLDVAVAAYENRWRMPENHPALELWLPDWVHDLIRTDLTRSMVGGSTDERLRVTDAQIDAFFDARNVNVTWLMDGETGAGQDFGAQEDNAALVGWPSTVVGYLWHQGAWAFLDQGTIDLGIIRDSVLAGTNDLQMFRETFEGALYRGWESLRMSLDVCPSGLAQGTASFDPCTTGS